MKKRLIPTDCENRATINYSMLPHFKSANIFRFFCLSLFRDKHYNVRKTLDELKRITGDSLSNFNSQFKDFLRIKHYYLDNGFENKTKRCIYHIPPMELKCVTFSRKIIGILKSATTRLYDTEAKIICIVSKKGAQCIECHHKDI